MEVLDEVRWRAVESRNSDVAGLFVYAVHTTGVYCRPGCGSRRPLRRNVEFFAAAKDAASAGYRACQRCSPDHDHAVDPSVLAVISVCRNLERLSDQRSIAAIAAEVGYSERHLRRRFSQIVGVPIGGYERELQAQRMRTALREGLSVTDAVYEAGYGSVSAFYDHGAGRLGMSAKRYRDGGRAEAIRYSSILTPLGVVVAASTAVGLCAVRVGPDESELVAQLAAEFPHAQFERDDDGLRALGEVLAGAARGAGDLSALPLDLRGTAFQVRVWEALRKIPRGQTRSYSELAAQIGAPRAVRAVASACAANPVALAVPCHRVLRQDGSLGGYRWGIATKRALLDGESGAAGA